MKYLILISIFLVGCSPCKFVAKHSECFPSDTIRIIDKVIHYETEYITNDSIVRDTIPCDPSKNIVYSVETIYKTKNLIIKDTIYQNSETIKINPLNDVLKKDKEKLESKINSKNTWIKILIGFSGLFLILTLLLLKFK